MVRKSVWALLLIVMGATAAAAQTVQTDPLQCWWRTSTGAVRIGEPFTVFLTCAVLETDEVTVVPDQTRLEPSVVQFAPFEVLGEEGLSIIEHNADTILEEVGIVFRGDPDARRTLREGGADCRVAPRSRPLRSGPAIS